MFVSLMAYAGLRPGEALALAWDHVDIYGGGGVLEISESYGSGELRETKTGHARTVGVCGPLADDFAAYIDSGARAGLVLPNRRGEYLDLRTWRRRYGSPRASVRASSA